MKFRADKRGATRRAATAVGLAALATAAFFAPPAAAEPAVAAQPAAEALCTTGTVQAKVNANVYSGWESTRVTGHATAFQNYPCNGHHSGRHYDPCGSGFQWVFIHAPNNENTGYVWGYAAAGCFSNQ